MQWEYATVHRWWTMPLMGSAAEEETTVNVPGAEPDTTAGGGSVDALARVRTLGQSGWELVGVEVQSDRPSVSVVYWLKRPKP